MARPKKGKAKPPESPEDRMAVIHLKGTRAYVEWLEEMHRKTRLAKATIIRMALEVWAKENGHKPPPEF